MLRSTHELTQDQTDIACEALACKFAFGTLQTRLVGTAIREKRYSNTLRTITRDYYDQVTPDDQVDQTYSFELSSRGWGTVRKALQFYAYTEFVGNAGIDVRSPEARNRAADLNVELIFGKGQADNAPATLPRMESAAAIRTSALRR